MLTPIKEPNGSSCLYRIFKKLKHTDLSFRLQVVSTKVGGVPEVLPPDLIRMAEPSAKGKYGDN